MDAGTQLPASAAHEAQPATRGAIDFWAHAGGDDVAVAVRDVAAGERVVVRFMDESRPDVELTAREAIPLGHKMALRDLAQGVPVVEYGERIGRTRTPVREGEHVHVHNLVSARWGR